MVQRTLANLTKLDVTRHDSPGAAAYTLPTTIGTGKAFSFGIRHKPPREDERSPGPAANYNPVEPYNPRTAPTLKERHWEKLETDSPGPKYAIPSSIQYKARNAPSIRSRPKDPTHSSSPGPAAYNITDEIGKPSLTKPTTPSASLSGRTKAQRYQDYCSPGPGAYLVTGEISGTKTKKGFTIGTPLKFDFERPDSPGPAGYNMQNFNSGSSRAKSAPRIRGRVKETYTSDSPGPAAYTIPSEIGHSGFSATLTGRVPSPRRASTPGPGAYRVPQTDFEKGRYSATLKSRHDVIDHVKSPGPAAYALPERKPSKLSILGKAQYKEPERSPGPAAYSPGPNPRWKSMPHISMKGTPVEKERKRDHYEGTWASHVDYGSRPQTRASARRSPSPSLSPTARRRPATSPGSSRNPLRPATSPGTSRNPLRPSRAASPSPSNASLAAAAAATPATPATPLPPAMSLADLSATPARPSTSPLKGTELIIEDD